ncbi:TetR/AcrR family transcriptional regulator [Mycolicibacterium septicum]|uniref:TetR/AcrR family transcriptional regulator n=1 Tax=Mycolicibacterium septicum TaxID=98668 RepID=UPI00235F12AA|nr:TetR/AcrR family transcriptional regulator [Mycolicibacterium septicum]
MATVRDIDHRRSNADSLLEAAAELLDAGGVDAVSTRAVAAAAGVQPPVIYRQFGDKDGLLDALTHYLLQAYITNKRQLMEESPDPLDQLRKIWDLHVEFALQHPAAYLLAYSPMRRPGELGAAAKTETVAMLTETVAMLGEQGQLAMSVERATRYVYAAGLGIIVTLLQQTPDERDHQLAEIVRENALSAILHHPLAPQAHNTELPARAVALAEALRRAEHLPVSPAEQALLEEWLGRLADQTTR